MADQMFKCAAEKINAGEENGILKWDGQCDFYKGDQWGGDM